MEREIPTKETTGRKCKGIRYMYQVNKITQEFRIKWKLNPNGYKLHVTTRCTVQGRYTGQVYSYTVTMET